MKKTVDSLTITKPNDFHLHLRDKNRLNSVIRHTTERFQRALIMPNLNPPINTYDRINNYREFILQRVEDRSTFHPLMSMYLTDSIKISDLEKSKKEGILNAVKYYPPGATTNSNMGVKSLLNCEKVLNWLQDNKIPLLLHGEVVDEDVDIYDREKVFIDKILSKIVNKFSNLKIVFEHITTSEAVSFVKASKNMGATITAHHLYLNRNDLLAGGIRPHNFCFPVAKREKHRRCLIEAAISGNSKFFLGTDSAPHRVEEKESSCGCAGIYTSHIGIEAYAEIFDKYGKLENLEGFCSFFGSDFYNLKRNTEKITLIKESWRIPKSYDFDGGLLIPFKADQIVKWKLKKIDST